MDLDIVNRLAQENKELYSLLKMKFRVESPKSHAMKTLREQIERLFTLEDSVLSQISYFKSLEEEIVKLRRTCDKFSELSSTAQATHIQYKALLESANSEKSKFL